MQYVGVAENQRLARYDFSEYIKEHKPHIKTINKQNLTIILNNDDSITFISETLYSKWCMGRTYKILGDEDHLYRSGHIQLESIYGIQSTEMPYSKLSSEINDLAKKGKEYFDSLPLRQKQYLYACLGLYSEKKLKENNL